MRERADEPFLEIMHEAAHIVGALAQVEHHVAHALPRSVIGELSAATGRIDGKAIGREKIFLTCARARCVEGRVLEQPDELRLATGVDLLDPTLHESERVGVIDRVVVGLPGYRFRGFNDHVRLRPYCFDGQAGNTP
jgi:hypothetical protein